MFHYNSYQRNDHMKKGHKCLINEKIIDKFVSQVNENYSVLRVKRLGYTIYL